MLAEVEGIILRQVKYSDSSRIVTVYTKELGKKAFFLNIGAKKKNGRLALAQPFSLLHLVASTGKNSHAMGRIKEFKISFPTLDIRSNIVKTSIVLFLTEILNKCINEEEQNEVLFDFFKNSIIALEQLQENQENFHLQFLIKFTHYLGIHPQEMAEEEGNYFDLKEGVFTLTRPTHTYFFTPDLGVIFRQLAHQDYGDKCKISKQQRSSLLEGLIEYYQIHLVHFSKVKSHHILAQVLA